MQNLDRDFKIKRSYKRWFQKALTFDDVTLAPKYSEILSEVNTSINLTKNLNLKSHFCLLQWILLQKAIWL